MKLLLLVVSVVFFSHEHSFFSPFFSQLYVTNHFYVCAFSNGLDLFIIMRIGGPDNGLCLNGSLTNFKRGCLSTLPGTSLPLIKFSDEYDDGKPSTTTCVAAHIRM